MTGSVQAGQGAAVAATVATVWTSPDAVRPRDAPAIAAVPDVPGWVSGMSREDRLDLHDRTLTQLLLGDWVLVEETVGGWAKVIVPDQPCARLDPRGYPGWLPAAHLVPSGAVAPSVAQVYVVDAMMIGLCATAGGDPVMPGVVLGTRLPAAGQARRGYLPVLVPGRAEPLWASWSDLVPAPTQPATAKQILEVAQRLVGVPYIWGGLSPRGIDCSGLVHLAHRRFGPVVPRDAGDQADATRPLGLDEEQSGDLYFFGRTDAEIHHVGFVTGDRQILHASQSAGRVQQDTLAGELADTLLATHRTCG